MCPLRWAIVNPVCPSLSLTFKLITFLSDWSRSILTIYFSPSWQAIIKAVFPIFVLAFKAIIWRYLCVHFWQARINAGRAQKFKLFGRKRKVRMHLIIRGCVESYNNCSVYPERKFSHCFGILILSFRWLKFSLKGSKDLKNSKGLKIILGKNHFKAIKCDSNDVKVACFLKNPYAICEASGGFSLRSKINQNSKFFLKM